MLLQGNLNEQLESFFQTSRANLTASIAPTLFIVLQRNTVRLRLIFDNGPDRSVQTDLVKDNVKELARDATKHRDQLIFTMQDVEDRSAAKSLLWMEPTDGRRWRPGIQILRDGGTFDTDDSLCESAIPDEVGRLNSLFHMV